MFLPSPRVSFLLSAVPFSFSPFRLTRHLRVLSLFTPEGLTFFLDFPSLSSLAPPFAFSFSSITAFFPYPSYCLGVAVRVRFAMRVFGGGRYCLREVELLVQTSPLLIF